MPEPKVYVPKSYAKQVTFQDGGSILNLSFHADTLRELAAANADDKGYLRLTVSQRREVGKYGATHSVSLNTYKPKQQQERREERQESQEIQGDEQRGDDIPF